MKEYRYSYTIRPLGTKNDEAYQAIIPKFGNLMVFGDTPQELYEAVMLSIEEEIKDLKKAGLPIPPEDVDVDFSGKILVRTEPELHEKWFYNAKASNMSLNKYLTKKLIEINA